MLCSTCQRENRPDSRFCLGCGAALSGDCATCGRALPADAAYCDGCGRAVASATPATRALAARRLYTPAHLARKVLQSRSALQGERKQVTVLFVDVKGSVELSTQVDSEQWHRTMDRFFLILGEGIHRYEGTINQYTGDGIMALFGAPVAHEDHAQRACHSALRLQEALRGFAHELRREHGLDFTVRMALHSGEVIVGRIGDDLRMDYTAKGQTVGLAARIEQVAEGGRIYVSEVVASRLQGWFQFEDLGEFSLKGLDEPSRLFELLGVGRLRSRIEMARERGFSRFVGRDAEIDQLVAALERASAGLGEVLGVVAEAGTGKSRLCLEFAERCRSHGIAVHRARAVSHGRGLSLLPILELLRSALGIDEAEDPERTRQKIAGALLLLDRALEAALPSLFDFMGVAERGTDAAAIAPGDRQLQLLEILLRLFTEPQRREPVVILVEDLHWIDPASEVLLGRLAAAVGGARILLLLNYRPEYQAGWMRSSFFGQISLAPLDAPSARALLHDLLGADSSLDELAELIGKRTGGNPFFVEEVVWSLVERGALTGSRGDYRLAAPLAQISIPESVQEVIAARIDRLADGAKALLQTAAVIGRTFSEDLLERVTETPELERKAALEELIAAELVHAETAFPRAEYAFRHPLTLEVAYRSQLSERRRRVHGAVASAIMTLGAERGQEGAALLAHHWEAAGEALEAARWYSRAAESAGFIDASGSLFHWEKVVELTRQVAAAGSSAGQSATDTDSAECDELMLRACWGLLDIGGRAGISMAEAEAVFEEGRRLAERRGDLRSLVRLHSGWAARLGWSGDRDAQRRQLLEADRLAEHLDDLEVRLVALQRRFVFEFHGGDMRSALALAEVGIEQIENAPHFADQHRFAHQRLLLSKATALAQLGRLEASAAELARADRVTPSGDEALGWEQNTHTRALICASQSLYRGDIDESLRDAEAFVALAERSGSSWAAPTSSLCLGRAQLLGERFAEAREALERALALSREADLGLDSEAATLACLAEAQTGCAEPQVAETTAAQAVSVAQRAETRFWELRAQLALAAVLLRATGPLQRERVAAALDRAEQLVEETGGAVMAPMLALRRAECCDRVGDETGRLRQLQLALAGFERNGADAHAARLRRQLESP